MNSVIKDALLWNRSIHLLGCNRFLSDQLSSTADTNKLQHSPGNAWYCENGKGNSIQIIIGTHSITNEIYSMKLKQTVLIPITEKKCLLRNWISNLARH